MRTLTVVLLVVPALAFAASKPIYVKVDIAAPPEIQDSVVTAVCRELRKSPDVVLTDSDENYGVSLMCTRVGTTEAMGCSLVFTEPLQLDSWKDLVKPQNDAAWKLLVSAYTAWKVDLYQTTYVVGFNRVDWVAGQISDTLNARFLESMRRMARGGEPSETH